MYQIGRSRRPSREAQSDRFLHTFAQLFVVDRRPPARGPLVVLRRRLERGSRTRSSAASGSGPGAKRSFATPSRSAISCARWPSSNAHTESAVLHVHGAVPRDARGPRVARDRRADRRRPALEQLRHAGLRAEARELARGSSLPSRSRLHLHDLRRLDRQRGRVRRRDHRLSLPARRSASTRRRPGSSSESTSSSSSSGGAVEQLRLREQQREHGQPLLALRAELAQVAVAARDQHVVEVRAERRSSPRSRSRARRASSSASGRRLGRRTRVARPAGRARRRARRSPARAARASRGARRPARAPSSATRSVHGSSASRSDRPSCTRRSAALRCASVAR